MDSCSLFRATLEESFTCQIPSLPFLTIRKMTGTDRLYSRWFIPKTLRRFVSSFQRKSHKTPVASWISKQEPSRRRATNRRCASAWDRDVDSSAAWRSATSTLRTWPSDTWIDWSNETLSAHRATARTSQSCTALATSRTGLQRVSLLSSCCVCSHSRIVSTNWISDQCNVR